MRLKHGVGVIGYQSSHELQAQIKSDQRDLIEDDVVIKICLMITIQDILFILINHPSLFESALQDMQDLCDVEWHLCPQSDNVTKLACVFIDKHSSIPCKQQYDVVGDGGDKTIKIHEKTAIKKC